MLKQSTDQFHILHQLRKKCFLFANFCSKNKINKSKIYIPTLTYRNYSMSRIAFATLELLFIPQTSQQLHLQLDAHCRQLLWWRGSQSPYCGFKFTLQMFTCSLVTKSRDKIPIHPCMKTPQMHQTKAIGDLNNNWLFLENSLRQKNDPAQPVIYSLKSMHCFKDWMKWNWQETITQKETIPGSMQHLESQGGRGHLYIY